MHFIAILTAVSVSVSAVIAMPLPQQSTGAQPGRSQSTQPSSGVNPGITWDTMPVLAPDPNYVPPIPPGTDKYKNMPNEDLPEWASGSEQGRWSTIGKEAVDDPAGFIFGGLQKGADASGDILQNIPGMAGLGAAAGAAYQFFNPPDSNLAPADASISPGS